ncbi:MAG: ATP-grasp domain-containing protein [Acidimicrobiia bacterium]|nr:ATP-grasp domain-containing protein [Acidimicrobiia bacterium]
MTRVLVVGDYRQTLSIARSLARRGDTVIAGLAEGRPSSVRRSRAVSTHWSHPPLRGVGFADALERAVDRHRPDVVFPVGDLEIGWFAAHDDVVSIPVAMPHARIVRTCQDKPDLIDLVRRLDVPTAASVTVGDLAGLRTAAEQVGYPVFVKPFDTLLRFDGRKGLDAADPESLAAVFEDWPEGHDRVIVQRYVAGTRHNLYFAAHRGELLGMSQVRIDRTDTPDGTGLAVDGRTIPLDPRLVAATARLTKDLKYTGVGCTQFLVREDGSSSFLELNPRLGANFAVARAAGLDLAPMAVDLALDRPVEPVATRAGVRYAWSLGELDGLVDALADGTVSRRQIPARILRMVRTAVAADVHVVWSWRDPGPAFEGLWRLTGRRVVNRLRRRSRGRASS